MLDLEPIKERHELTSPGTWIRAEQDYDGWAAIPPMPPDQVVMRDDAPDGERIAVFESEQDAADAEFVACAHQDVPALVEEVEELRATLEGMCYQFGDRYERDGRSCLGTMGLSNLEWAFAFLGWDDPHLDPLPIPQPIPPES